MKDHMTNIAELENRIEAEIAAHNAAIDAKKGWKKTLKGANGVGFKGRLNPSTGVLTVKSMDGSDIQIPRPSIYPKTTPAVVVKYELVRHNGEPVIKDGAVLHRRLVDGFQRWVTPEESDTGRYLIAEQFPTTSQDKE